MIGIICGEGAYPELVIKECQKKDIPFCIILVDGYKYPKNYSAVPKLAISLGQIGKAISFLKLHNVDKLIFAGHIRRPTLTELSFDIKGIIWILKLWKQFLYKGDNSLLTTISLLLSKENITLVSGTDFLDDIFLEEGIFSNIIPTKEEQKDIELGIREARSLGLNDLGQSIVVSNGNVIAREDKTGTDSLIERCYEGILVKVSKPQQDERLDLPAIGPKTIENLHRHGFKGLVVESGKTIIIDKQTVIRKVNEYGLFFQAIKLKKDIKIFMMAGEASGDYLGSKLIKNLNKLNNNIEFMGIGGQCMEECNLVPLFHISELSIMGILEVFGKIFHIKKLINKTADTILNYKPDVVVGIDSSGFMYRVYKLVKKKGYTGNIIHYVAPPVWAWRSWRARTMHNFIDKLLVLLPFEKDIFTKYGLNTEFVGHPIVMDKDFKITEKNSDTLAVTLLPGSRKVEIEKHMPVLQEFVELMKKKYPKVQFFLPTVREVAPIIKKFVDTWKVKPIVSTKKTRKIKAYNLSTVAVAASGTVTLELAKMHIPFVVIYKTSSFTYHLVKLLIHVPYVCLVNILAKKKVIPELLQDDCCAEKIFNEVENIINSQNGKKQIEEFENIVPQLIVSSDKAAREILL